ncbi:recombinase family protein [Yersinia pseudotuberculosis]|nr:recombinase family protein [Yersinia pseudotuberculosis]
MFTIMDIKMITKTAYCYCRVSSSQQADDNGGFGMTRQQATLIEYISSFGENKKLGYALSPDQVVFLRAEGESGFTGKNIEKGSILLNFIEDIKSKKIKNSVLLIENIDRFSRFNVNESTELFLSIVNNGCDIHECDGGVIHHRKSDTNLISAGLTRARAESYRKSKFSIKNWDKRFENTIKDKSVLTHHSPSWLNTDGGFYTIIESEAVVYRKIFEMFNNGYGQAAIRTYLNDNGMTINGNTIGTWMIHKVLKDDRLWGRLRTKSDLRKEHDGLLIYPVVVEREIVNTAALILSSKGKSIKINKRANNIFTGLMICGVCKNGHLLVNHDKRGSYLRCSNSLSSNTRCIARGFKYGIVEQALIKFIKNIDTKILDSNDDNILELDRLGEELKYYLDYMNQVQQDFNSVDIPDPNDRKLLKNLQSKVRVLEDEILKIKSFENSEADFEVIQVASINPDLLDPFNVDLRKEFNIKLRKIIQQIEAFRYDNNILIAIKYYAVKNQQWLLIDSKTGDMKSHTYIDEEHVVIEGVDQKPLRFDVKTKQYKLDGTQISVEYLISELKIISQ